MSLTLPYICIKKIILQFLHFTPQRLFLVVTLLHCSVIAVKPPNYIEKPKVPDKVSAKKINKDLRPTIYLSFSFHLFICRPRQKLYVFMASCYVLLYSMHGYFFNLESEFSAIHLIIFTSFEDH